METLHALQEETAGIDVHRMLHVVTVLIEQDDDTVRKEQRQFRGFKRDKRAMATWLASLGVQLVVMESTGIYWKSPYAFLEQAGITTWVVNAHHVKHVPGRKTDMADSEWLAVLGRFGLVRGSFIPPQDLRELRLVSRYAASWHPPWRRRRTACIKPWTMPASPSGRSSPTSTVSRPDA